MFGEVRYHGGCGPGERMSKLMAVVPSGSTILVSSGSYDEHSVEGVFTVLTDFDPGNLLNLWLTEHPEQRTEKPLDSSGYTEWLSSKALIARVPHLELHISDSGKRPQALIYNDSTLAYVD